MPTSCDHEREKFVMEEEEDVIFEGSPLHEEFKLRGIPLEVTSFRSHGKSSESVWPLEDTSPTDEVGQNNHAKEESQALCTDIAQKILDSSLLIVEDEDFISNFILSSAEDSNSTDKTLCVSNAGGDSSLGNVLFYSCSIAALAGTLLLLSDRTKMTAATIATLVPAGIAAIASGPSLFKRPKPSEKFLRVLADLLEDMKLFKILVRKTLNLLQGMEFLQTGVPLPPINSSHGGMDTTVRQACNVSFPALRTAAYKCTVDLVRAYRGAVRTLLEVSPLADHIDHQEHYIAFVELEKFEIVESTMPSIKSLKDAVQLALIQQSEYLRRFSLTFCEKAREDKKLSKAGVLKQIHELALTIKKINKKLSSVFEYHQAMGVIEDKTKLNLKLRRPTSLDLIPLKSIYTSLFSSGLHLQNSLLKVRELEKIFENIDFQRKKAKKHIKQEDSNEMLPNEEQLSIWLNGFKEIQKELEACVVCLDDGATHVSSFKNKGKGDQAVSPEDCKVTNSEGPSERPPPIVIDESPIEHVDEVFEAVIDANVGENKDEDNSASLFTDEELRRRKAESRVLEELKSVLSHRSVIQERREAEALAKKKGLISPDMNESEIEEAIASQSCSLSVKGLNSPISIQSVDIQEKMIKQELAKVMEEISDIEEEIIKTDFGLPLESTCTKDSEMDAENELPVSISNESLSSSDTDCSSNCSRDTVKSIRESRLSPLSKEEILSSQEEIGGSSVSYSNIIDPMVNSDVEHDICGPKSLSECLRSISTPDLKSVPEGSSKYRTIESANNIVETVLDHDSDPGSADEMENRVLKVYKRPLRPAALKKINAMKHRSNGTISAPQKSSGESILGSSYLSKQNPEDLVIPGGPPPASLLGTSTNNFVSQIRAKANAFKVALQESEKVFGNQ